MLSQLGYGILGREGKSMASKKAVEMSNQEIAELLREVAAAYEVKGEERFKVAAYEEAAAGVEHASSAIKDLWDDGKLEEIPGVGKGIAVHLDELFRKGKVKHFEAVTSGLPPAMFEFLRLRGVGPKTAYKLAKELGIKKREGATAKLTQAARKGKIAKVAGFGEETEKAVLAEAGREESETGRMLLPEAWELAEAVISYLKEEKAVKRADPLGSLRRRAATIGDVDVAVATNEPKKVLKHFLAWPKIKKKLAAGENTVRVILTSGRQVDVKTQAPAAYGAMLQYFTGSKQHNIHLRTIAKEKGLSLSEYGIKSTGLRTKAKGQVRKFETEEGFYKYLGMGWLAPELREDTGEIEAALRSFDRTQDRQARGKPGGLPKLVEEKEIKGDLHVHSAFVVETSHDEGVSSIEEIMKQAQNLGYEYVGVSEHNPSQSQHKESQVLDILKRKQAKVEQINGSWKRIVKKRVKILNGLEVDIRPSGELAIPEKGFEFLDFAIVSVHASFRQPKKEMTKRVLSALAHPKAKILGHPTGRMLQRREGVELDWEKVLAFCKKEDKWLEINSWPARLDLPDVLVREAVKSGVKLVINTDSHVAEQMGLMRYGVSVARRGWAETDDIANTRPVGEISKLLK